MKFWLVILVLLYTSNFCAQKKELVSTIGNTEAYIKIEPLLIERKYNDLVTLKFEVEGSVNPAYLREIIVNFEENSSISSLSSITAWNTGLAPGESRRELFAVSDNPEKNTALKGKIIPVSGENSMIISFTAKPDADLSGHLGLESITLLFSGRITRKCDFGPDNIPIRFGKILRASGQDGCDTYRIPGLVTTNSGTLIAVYDVRYNNSKDLQENIDIGMSRSTDGGQTWEPMKIIMDMDKYGGLPEEFNGTGDPCILYDHFSNTLWVAALWMNGSSPDKMIWWESRPGMTPQETGQFLLVKSNDDGLTWSEPINITDQIKKPDWQLLLQGPGRGITMSNGTLVFPAQFKEDIGVKAIDGGQYTCHSTIVYSDNKGDTWKTGTGAKPNTSEAQVVELSDGSLMLNMRDDRNRKDKGVTNGRAVYVTNDFGMTWKEHPTSNSALPEPNCMASLIAAELNLDGSRKRVLFFSNPDNKTTRAHMTVKASLDEGLTWPEMYSVEIFESEGYGYSCLTMIDDKHLGILYEGIKELYFQKIPVSDILNY